MRVMAPSPNAPPAPQITLMPQAAAIVADRRASDAKNRGSSPQRANADAITRLAASTMKQTAAAGDMRDDRSDAAANNAASTEPDEGESRPV